MISAETPEYRSSVKRPKADMRKRSVGGKCGKKGGDAQNEPRSVGGGETRTRTDTFAVANLAQSLCSGTRKADACKRAERDANAVATMLAPRTSKRKWVTQGLMAWLREIVLEFNNCDSDNMLALESKWTVLLMEQTPPNGSRSNGVVEQAVQTTHNDVEKRSVQSEHRRAFCGVVLCGVRTFVACIWEDGVHPEHRRHHG